MPYYNSYFIYIGLSIESVYISSSYCKFKPFEFALKFLNIWKNYLNMPFYAVAVGKVPGVYNTWEECQLQTNGFPKPKFRKFNTKAEAEEFVRCKGFGVASAYSSSREEKRFPTIPSILCNLSTTVSDSSLTVDPQAKWIADQFEEVKKRLDNIENRLAVFEALCPVGDLSFSDCKRKSTVDETTNGEKTANKKKKRPGVTIDVSSDEDNNQKDSPGNSTRSKKRGKPAADVEVVDGPCEGQFNTSEAGMQTTRDGFVVVYTDGACSKNGKVGAKAGIGVWFNHNNPFNVAAPVVGVATNNNAEIQAATRAIEQAQLAGLKKLNIHTDSQFLINCITDWIKKWKRNNWMTSQGEPVKNREQLIILEEAMRCMEAIRWTHVRGHHGVEGNECADALAREGAKMYR